MGSTTVIPVDVRVIAATNPDLQQQIAKGRFRSDLLYRLNALEIHIPPLRERPADIPPLLEHQMCILSAELGKSSTCLNCRCTGSAVPIRLAGQCAGTAQCL